MQVISLSFLASIGFVHLKELDNRTSVEKNAYQLRILISSTYYSHRNQNANWNVRNIALI
jgi:hypothetical protein